jgi:hypothetical protein
VNDQTRDPDESQAISDGNDVTGSLRGLQAVVSRKENERQAAITRAEVAEADAAELRTRLDSMPQPQPRMDANNPRRQPPTPPDPMAALKGATWEQFGFEEPRRR